MELCNIECWRIYLGWKTEKDLFNAVEHLLATKTKQQQQQQQKFHCSPSPFIVVAAAVDLFFAFTFIAFFSSSFRHADRNVGQPTGTERKMCERRSMVIVGLEIPKCAHLHNGMDIAEAFLN